MMIKVDTMVYCSLALSALGRASKPVVGAYAPDRGRLFHRMEKERKHE
jgi:hypothetical protein